MGDARERIQGKGTFVTTDQQRRSQKLLDIFAIVTLRVREGLYPSLIHGFEEESSHGQYQTLIRNSENDLGKQADLILQMIDQRIGDYGA